jgi:hypothetical protein
MTQYARLTAALVATLVSHVHARPAIEDPSYCAEFYPNANCRSLGLVILTPMVVPIGSPPNYLMKRSGCSSFPKRKTWYRSRSQTTA